MPRRTTFILFIVAGLVMALLLILSPPPGDAPAADPVPAEVVQNVQPSRIRVLRPADVMLEDLEMNLTPTRQAPGLTAGHDLVITNKGDVAFDAFLLELFYLDRSGHLLETRRREVKGLGPGRREPFDLIERELPLETARAAVQVLYGVLP